VLVQDMDMMIEDEEVAFSMVVSVRASTGHKAANV
jgi:hypothetical protein